MERCAALVTLFSIARSSFPSLESHTTEPLMSYKWHIDDLASAIAIWLPASTAYRIHTLQRWLPLIPLTICSHNPLLLPQISNRDPPKSSILSSPFLPPRFPPPSPSNRTLRALEPGDAGPLVSLLDDISPPVTLSPMIRSTTFALAPARLKRSSKSATLGSVFAVEKVRGSVRW